MAKSELQKRLEKQAKKCEKDMKKQEIQSKAQCRVNNSQWVSGFRIMDNSVELFFKEILAQYDGNDKNWVDFKLPSYLSNYDTSFYEALALYGVIEPRYIPLGRGAGITLTESGKKYFENKQTALENTAKEEKEKNMVANQINGNYIFIQNNTNTQGSIQAQNSTDQGIDFAELEKILGQILSKKPLFEEEFGENGPVLENAIDEAKDAVGHKKIEMLKKPLGIIKDIFVSASGSIIAPWALKLLAPFLNFINL